MKSQLKQEKRGRAPVAHEPRKMYELWGLCRTCRHAAECTFPRDPDHPVLMCEEFEGIRPSPEAAPEISAKPRVATEKTTRLQGLCVNCANRDTCTFPKPEGGVWHCEEYR